MALMSYFCSVNFFPVTSTINSNTTVEHWLRAKSCSFSCSRFHANINAVSRNHANSAQFHKFTHFLFSISRHHARQKRHVKYWTCKIIIIDSTPKTILPHGRTLFTSPPCSCRCDSDARQPRRRRRQPYRRRQTRR